MKSDAYFVQAKEYAAELRLGAIKSDLEESISDAAVGAWLLHRMQCL